MIHFVRKKFCETDTNFVNLHQLFTFEFKIKRKIQSTFKKLLNNLWIYFLINNNYLMYINAYIELSSHNEKKYTLSNNINITSLKKKLVLPYFLMFNFSSHVSKSTFIYFATFQHL